VANNVFDAKTKWIWKIGGAYNDEYAEFIADFNLTDLKEVYLKGRSALLDFDDKRGFWAKRIQNEIGYYSFGREIGLFLDTFRKNSYNTLIK